MMGLRFVTFYITSLIVKRQSSQSESVTAQLESNAALLRIVV